MNTQRVLDDIEQNKDKLPEYFSANTYYNRHNKCYCLFGWLGVVTGGPDAARLAIETEDDPRKYLPLAKYLHERYEIEHDVDDAWDEIAIADDVILQHTNEGFTLRSGLAPALPVIEDYKKLLLEEIDD